jgi:hypothetical protein
MVQMLKTNPELAKSTASDAVPNFQTTNARPMSAYSSQDPGSPGGASRHDSVSSRRSFFAGSTPDFSADGISDNVDGGGGGDDDEVPVGHHFTYIPPNPKKFYQRLLEYCLVADLEKMLSPEVDDNEEVSLGILSPAHIDLINECALRWRIGQPYRATCFLDLVRQFYERNDVPLECVPEALQATTKAMQDTDFAKWPIADVGRYLLTIYPALTSSSTVRISLQRLRQLVQHLSILSLPCYGHTTQLETCGSGTVHIYPRPCTS